VYSINRLFFLSLGSVCFLLVPFFWLSLSFDFSALENFVVDLSTAEFVGYPIPELLGSEKGETVVDQVLRIKIFFTVLVVAYSLLFVGLSYLEGARRRIRFCARGIAIPLLLLILGFWLKFISDDHIISKIEKSELFKYTIGCLVVSVMLYAYSFHSRKKVEPAKPKAYGDAISSSPPGDSSSVTTKEETEVSTGDGVADGNLEEVGDVPSSGTEPPLPDAMGDEAKSDTFESAEENLDPAAGISSPLPEEPPSPEPDDVETASTEDGGLTPPPVPEEHPDELGASLETEPPLPDAMGDEAKSDTFESAEENLDPAADLPPPLPEEPPSPEPDDVETASTEVGSLTPPPVPEEPPSLEVASGPPIENMETESREQEIPETKSVLSPPTSVPPSPEEAPPAPAIESIAETYKFPSEKEEFPDDQSGDSSLKIDDKDTEELKPPPF
jgi:hypothetical protein